MVSKENKDDTVEAEPVLNEDAFYGTSPEYMNAAHVGGYPFAVEGEPGHPDTDPETFAPDLAKGEATEQPVTDAAEVDETDDAGEVGFDDDDEKDA